MGGIMNTKQEPTKHEITEYALKRWAEEKGKARDNYSTDHILIDMRMEILTDDGGVPMGLWYTPDDYGLESVTIDHKLFAELPMDDEEKFVHHLNAILEDNYLYYANPPNGWTTEHIIGFIKATIDQLLLAYYNAGREGLSP